MIRYDKKLNAEIRRAVNNFNAKIRRLEKMESTNVMIPEKIKVSDFKKGYDSRRDLRRQLNYLKMFSKRGAEEKIVTTGGYETSKYQVAVVKRESARVKRNLTRQINMYMKITPSVFGVKQEVNKARMEDTKLTNLKSKREALNKNLLDLNAEQYNRYLELLNNQRQSSYKDRIFKENYLEMLLSTGYISGYDTEKIGEMASQLIALDVNNFTRLFDTESAVKNILENYDLLKINNFDTSSLSDVFRDINELYDNLYNSLPEILKDYK